MVDDIVAALDEQFPPQLADDWDRVGLVVGEPAMPVRKVLFVVEQRCAYLDADGLDGREANACRQHARVRDEHD